MKTPGYTVKLQDQDMTGVQGFESASGNVILLYPGDCPKCLRPFANRGAGGVRINVFTAYGKDQWCSDCVKQGLKDGICVQESKLSKKEVKIWEKQLKKEGKPITV